MILQYFIKDKREIRVIILHVLLAILSLYSAFFFIGWFYFVIATSITSIINNKTRSKAILLVSGYFLGMELIGRMLKASPFIPYQVGTYYMLVVFTYGILKTPSGKWGNTGKMILLLCIPGFYMIPFDNYFVLFVNSFSGIVCLALGAVYFKGQMYTREDLRGFIKVTVLPVIVIAIYVSIKTPSLNDVDFSLSSNFDTSGGFGSNQVSTVLGLGACLLILAYLRKDTIFSSYKPIIIILIAVFVFRGLLTFSRGGILGGLVAVTLSYLFLNWKLKKNISRSIFQLGMIATGCLIIFMVSDQITGGILSERYRGETAGTLSGNKAMNLNTFTSNRSKIAMSELEIFSDHVFFGVGPGGGYNAREKEIGIRTASHTEFTRLLAEQGIPGLLIGIIFIFYPIFRIKNSKSSQEAYYLIAFFSLAVITSFHSAMRTMLTPLFWSLSCARYSFSHTSKRINPNRTNRSLPLSTHEANGGD